MRRVPNRPALLTVDHPPQALMEKAGLELEDPPIQWPARPVLAYLGRTTRLVYSVGSAQVPWSLEGFLEACATLPLNLAPSARIEPSPRIRFPKRGPTIVSAVTTGTLRAAQVRTGRITARTAPAVANILASSHRAVVAARVLQHRLGETESIPALAGLHAAPALGLVGLVDDHIDLEPIVIALKPKPRRPAATETAVELPWRLALSPGPSARWAHATSPVDHGGRTELWHTRLARQVGDTTAESGQWVRAIWARDFDQFPDALAEPGDATKFPPTEGGGDSPNFTSALTSARPDAAVPRDGQLPAAPQREALGPAGGRRRAPDAHQPGWLARLAASPRPPSRTRTSGSWSGGTCATQGRGPLRQGGRARLACCPSATGRP